MKLLRLVYLGLLLAGAVGTLNAQTGTPGSGAETDPPQVVVANVSGVIGPAQADWVDQVLTRAGDQGAAAVLLRLDTPGGLTASMRTIIQSVLNSPVPVIGWVGPSGSRAASA
ncbi:MAG: nodulation protein NfeD, partial [Thiohalorhabdaceae bacterium]